MPYLLLTQSALLWRVNHVAGHILAQGANPRHMAEVSWALNGGIAVSMANQSYPATVVPPQWLNTANSNATSPGHHYWFTAYVSAGQSGLYVCNRLHRTHY